MTLEERWNLEKQSPLSGWSEPALDALKTRQVYFVSGMANEVSWLVSWYFRSNRQVLEEELGVTTRLANPSSFAAIKKNANFIYHDILKTYAKFKKPMIIVGHSKGGAEVLYMIFKHPSLILENIIDRVVLIQAAIGGSPLVCEESQNWYMKWVSQWMGSGFSSLDTRVAQFDFNRVFDRFKKRLQFSFGNQGDLVVQQKAEQISNKVFYVRSHSDVEKYGLAVRFARWTCGEKNIPSGQNDGVLELDAQKLTLKSDEEFGVDLGVIFCDHNALTLDGFFSSGTNEDRRAFTRALFQQIFEY